MNEKIRKIINEFETGLLSAGLSAENVDYDKLAAVRRKCWDKLEKEVIETQTKVQAGECTPTKNGMTIMLPKVL